MHNQNQVTMTVTFADGSRFHLLADKTMVDDKGFVITRENCPDHYDDMVKTVAPNVAADPQKSSDQLKRSVVELSDILRLCSWIDEQHDQELAAALPQLHAAMRTELETLKAAIEAPGAGSLFTSPFAHSTTGNASRNTRQRKTIHRIESCYSIQ